MYCSYFEHCDICKHLLNCIFTYSITLHFTALWILSGTTRVSQYEKKHSPTHTYRPLSASSIYYNPRHPPCSIYVSDSLLPQSLSKFSVVYPLGVGSVSSGTGSPGCPGQNPESRKTVVCVCMCVHSCTCTHILDTHTHNHFMALLDFVRDFPAEPAPER